MKPALLLSLFLIQSSRIILAQNPTLISDINQQALAVTDFSLPIVGSDLYINGTDNLGEGLWRTDGTAEGTYRFSSEQFGLSRININGIVYFEGSDGELHKTDGTEAGTVLIKDIEPGEEISSPNFFVNMNGVLFFRANKDPFGWELWKSDGTEAGTVMIKDIVNGSGSSVEPNVDYEGVVLNGKFLFLANSETKGRELFISDGTQAGTFLLKDIYPGSSSSDISHMVVFNGAAYFHADDGIHDGLWKSDGTANGTVLVKYLGVQEMIATNQYLLISASEINGTTGTELWKSNGTSPGTQLLEDIYPGALSSNPAQFTTDNNIVYFKANDGVHGTEPWKSDGTIAGTTFIHDLKPGTASLDIINLTLVGSKIFIGAVNVQAAELWVTDGTSEGTVDLTPSLHTDDHLFDMIAFDGKLYFTSGNDTLWRSDGTIPGTYPLNIISSQTQSSDITSMVKVEDNLFVFVADDGIHGHELWVTDNKTTGTFLLKDFYEGTTTIKLAGSFNEKVLFSVNTADPGISGLWVTDGTINGTKKIGGDSMLDCSGCDFNSVTLNDIAYFLADERLWRTDGTEAGTYMVADPEPTNEYGYARELTVFGDHLYFAADDGIHGIELWTSDGTASGTYMLKDLKPNGDGDPDDFTVAGGMLFFDTGKLWKTDGTANGTVVVKDINSSNHTAVGSDLFFQALINTDFQLWKSDGTTAGTVLVKGFNTSSAVQSLNELTDVNGTLFFSFKGDLWKSDGTEAGTVIVSNVEMDEGVNVAGYLYFEGYQTNIGSDLWRSDGTYCRTQQLDFYEEGDDEANILLVDDNIIYLTLNSLEYGNELWRYETAPIPTTEICNGLDDDCNGTVDDNTTVSITPSGTIQACKNEKITLTSSNKEADSYQWRRNGVTLPGATTSVLITSAGGSFDLVVTSSSGCTDISAATVINRVPLPLATITPLGSLDICNTGSVVLKANNGNGYAYQWKLNNIEIPGATKKQYTATSTGNYKVEVTNAHDCSKTSGKATVFTSCKEMNESFALASVIAYPNPFNDVIHLDLSKLNWYEDQLEIRIADLSGKILFQKSFSYQDKIEIGNELPNGFYLVEVKGKNNQQVIPVVKE